MGRILIQRVHPLLSLMSRTTSFLTKSSPAPPPDPPIGGQASPTRRASARSARQGGGSSWDFRHFPSSGARPPQQGYCGGWRRKGRGLTDPLLFSYGPSALMEPAGCLLRDHISKPPGFCSRSAGSERPSSRAAPCSASAHTRPEVRPPLARWPQAHQ